MDIQNKIYSLTNDKGRGICCEQAQCPHQPLTCHSEDSHHQINAAVSQQGHFHSRGCTFLLFPFGLESGPDAGSEGQQVKKT